MVIRSLLPPLLGLAGAPLLLGTINKLKAAFVGRTGAPLTQPYHDLARLLRKNLVYSSTTTWLFRALPAVSLAAGVAVVLLLPALGQRPPFSFPADFLVLAGALALSRASTVLAALDTGSSFEGMGASRELFIAALAEPAFFLVLLVLVTRSGELSWRACWVRR